MKYRAMAAIAASFMFFTGCGKVGKTDDPTVTTPPATSAATSAETTAAVTTTSVTTTAAVTTKPEPPADLELIYSDTVEVHNEIKLSDFITSSNVELTDPDMLIDTSQTGETTMDISYKSGGNTFDTQLKYTVTDTEPPLILNSGWNPVHVAGTPFDLNDYVGFADDYDRDPVLTYTGSIDPNTPGSYPLTATVTDSSGNSQSWDVTITVADSKPDNVDNTPRVDFSDFISRYNGEGLRYGIDVSTWQGEIDFNAVKAAGCSFVMIRMGYYYGDGITMDKYYQSNIANARAAGLDVGVYFYTTDNSEEGARERADWIAEQLGGEPLELPVAFDWEEFGGFQEYGMSIYDLNQYYLAFADQMKKHGYSTMLYSSRNFLNDFWYESTKAATPVWLAHFVDETDYSGDYAIWQASCYGHIPGIYGDVDMNILYQPLPLE